MGAFPFNVTSSDGRARAGVLATPRGQVRTPAFMPVGTVGTVKGLYLDQVEETGADIILGNTYHLMLRPGADVVAELGGLHRMMDWDGHVLTDSGGYQVFSLAPKVDDEGAVFRSTYDGSTHRLTPEGAVAIQEQLGADIQMVLDVCAPLPSSTAVLREAVDRTAAWAARAKAARRHETQALFGIAQGGTDPALRAESARRTVDLDFDGYAVGGLSVGESREDMLPALKAAIDELPGDRPRYLMGVGDPAGMVEAVGLGIDMFDCVLPTRLARHGTLLTAEGRINLKNARFARDDRPPDPSCGCPTCSRWSRGYLRHLLQVAEPTAGRLLTVHNVAWILDLVR
ncbi:MAG TPA: tRNA guanosine(34) transglycosylase Tgt, partial [Acidimicrobiales bacterium]|nr:tRNA guanosine(34) transglycosylase Tgt [Acidimicrobiales bacterium]